MTGITETMSSTSISVKNSGGQKTSLTKKQALSHQYKNGRTSSSSICGLYVTINLVLRVSTSRRVLVQQAEESARLAHEISDLDFQKAQLEETHK